MLPALGPHRLVRVRRPSLLVTPFAPPGSTQDGGAQRSRGCAWGLLRLVPFPAAPLGAKRREPRGRGPGGDRGTCVAGPRARAQPAPPPPGPGLARSLPFPVSPRLTHCLVVVCHHQASKAEVSPPARDHLHFRDVWAISSQRARLWGSRTGIWPPFPPLRLHFLLTHFFLRFSLYWRLLTSLPN